MSLGRLGEFRLIDRLAGVLGRPTSPDLLLGIGDDAAVWRPTPGAVTVATADALVQGVHFDLATASWTDLGWKALAENVSDVAAMGCEPHYALVALALPGDVDPSDIEALYRGMAECAAAYGCAVVGGDVVSAPTVMISVTLIGESLATMAGATGQPPLLTRSSARPGHVLAVTGALGTSAAGLRLLQNTPLPNPPPRRGREHLPSPLTGEGEGESPGTTDILIQAHLRPTPRVAAGCALVQAGIRCAIDVSDGLVADVGHICERSDVDAVIDAALVPIHAAVSARFPKDSLGLALTGGEDYELVCAGPRASVGRATELLRALDGLELTIIGEIVARRGAEPDVTVRGAGGEPLTLQHQGYQHFAANGTRSQDG